MTDLLDMPDSQLLVYRDEDGTIMIDIRTHEADVPLDEMLVGGDRA